MVGRPTRREYLISMGASAVALGGADRAVAAPDTVAVPDDEPTIQAAVDRVTSGGTVEVAAGTYTESVTVGKPVTIVGDSGGDDAGPGPDAPVLDGGGATETAGIQLHHAGRDPDDVTVRGLIIQNYGRRPESGEWGHGVAAGRGNDHVTVTDCRIDNVGAAGVSVSGPGEHEYRDWTVERCRFVGAPLAGIRFDHVSEATVADNEFVAPDGFEAYPRFGVYVHTNTDRGHSSTQAGVDIRGNRFEGRSGRSAVWLLAINKNDPDSDTHAELRDVTVADNEFDAMPGSAAIAAAANAVQGATTRLRNLAVTGNTVRNAESGITIDSGATEGVSDVVVSRNDVRESRFGIQLSGRVPAAVSGVRMVENVAEGDVLGAMVANHERDGDTNDTRPAVDDVEVVRGEYRGGEEWGIAFNSSHPNGIGDVTVTDAVTAGKEAVHAAGEAAGAFGSVTISGGQYESTEGAGLHVSGHAGSDGDEPAMRTALVEDVNVEAVGPGVAITGGGGRPDAPGVGDATLQGVTVDDGRGFLVVGESPDGVGAVSGTDLTSHGTAGLRVRGLAPGSVHGVDVDGLEATDATEGPGLDVTGRYGDAAYDGDRPHVGPVTLSNATITGREAGVTLLGRVPNALDDVSMKSVSIDTTGADEAGPGIYVAGEAPAAMGQVGLRDADLAAKAHGVMVNGETADAGLSLAITETTVTSDEGGGVVLHGGRPGSIDSVDLANVTVERAPWNGLRVDGFAPGAVGDVTGSDVTVATTSAPGVQVVGEHSGVDPATPAVDTVDLDGVDVSTQATPGTEDGHDGIVVRGQDDATLGTVAVRNGTIDADFIGVSAAAERNGEVAALTLDGLDVTSGAGGVEVAAHGDATLADASLTDLTIHPGWAGLQVHGREGGRVANVTASGVDVNAPHGPGLLVNGHESGAVGKVHIEGSRFVSDEFLGNMVRADEPGGVESVSLVDCDLSDSHTGLFVWGRAPDAVQTVDITGGEVRDNQYGVIVAGAQGTPQRADAVTIRTTNLVGNSFEYEGDTRGYAVLNIADGVVDARENYWGAPSGPAYPRPGENPANAPNGDTPEAVLENYPRHADFVGTGDRVSQGVRYGPYLRQQA